MYPEDEAKAQALAANQFAADMSRRNAATQQRYPDSIMAPGMLGGLNAGEPELARAINEIHTLRKMIEEARASLSDFADRMLIGDEPMCDTAENTCSPVQPFNHGVTGQLRRALADASVAASDVASQARRLRQIG